MIKVLTLLCLLAVANHAAAQCKIPTYTETLIPECAPNDIHVKWPNYEDATSYYQCAGVNEPVAVSCGARQYFCFVQQECVSCSQYLPPVQCPLLRMQNPPNCVPIGSNIPNIPTAGPNPTSSTPSNPSGSTTTQTSTSTTTTTHTTTTNAPETTTSTAEAPATPPSVPAPPSPDSGNPDVPLPPSPDPTPPSVPVAPPPLVG